MFTIEFVTWLVVAPVVTLLLITLFGVLPEWLDRRWGPGSGYAGQERRGDSPPLHTAPFRPYTVAAARGVARAHACCSPERCGAKAAALSVLIAAGMTRYPARSRRGGLWA